MLTLIFLHQIKEPEDFKLWHETMVTEFPERFQRLLAGPMWSGLDPQDIRDPMKVKQKITSLGYNYITIALEPSAINYKQKRKKDNN